MSDPWPPQDAPQGAAGGSDEESRADSGPEWPDEEAATAGTAAHGSTADGSAAHGSAAADAAASGAAAPADGPVVPEAGGVEGAAELGDTAEDEPGARGIAVLLEQELLVPIRSSSGESPDPSQLSLDSMRHGTDARGRFLAAFSDPEAFSVLGPPGSDHVVMAGRELCERAERADERVIVNPGSPDQVEIPAGVLPFLLAGVDLASPGALRSLRPLGGLPDLEAPHAIPEPFGAEMRAALEELPAVERAWLLRVGTAWTVGVQLADDAPLSEFDVVRNRLHALAAEHLGTRRNLVVTDLRAPSLRAHYETVAAPFYEPPEPKGFFTRLLGLDR